MHPRILELAALATFAVPQLEVVSVTAAPAGQGLDDAAVLRDGDGNLLVSRKAATPRASDRQLRSVQALRAMSDGVRSRLPFAVPQPIGVAMIEDGSVAVTNYLEGVVPGSSDLPENSPLIGEIANAVAAIHALPTEFIADAGLPERSIADERDAATNSVERAKATGRLPVTLERRWFTAIGDAAMWQAHAGVTHGSMRFGSLLVDGHELVAVTGWAKLGTGDPARDLAFTGALSASAERAFHDAYAAARGSSVDRQVRQRARLYSEIELADALTDAVERDDDRSAARYQALLERLMHRVADAADTPIVHETLPVLDLEGVRELLRDAQSVRERNADPLRSESGPVETGDSLNGDTPITPR